MRSRPNNKWPTGSTVAGPAQTGRLALPPLAPFSRPRRSPALAALVLLTSLTGGCLRGLWSSDGTDQGPDPYPGSGPDPQAEASAAALRRVWRGSSQDPGSQVSREDFPQAGPDMRLATPPAGETPPPPPDMAGGEQIVKTGTGTWVWSAAKQVWGFFTSSSGLPRKQPGDY